MSHKRRVRWSVRFELAPENPMHVALNDYLKQLAADERASEWMRETLIKALPNRREIIFGADVDARERRVK